ncbi:M16 family metallopeptidase [Streptomyces sp. NPDC002888]|uniref:M16 family metallopeptidase n=1 Tax=Streptomyces sp. NPDC002888 TaxID=3364668 RepID=UPI003694A6DE
MSAGDAFLLPEADTRHLDTGVRVLTVPRTGTETVEVRVQIPCTPSDGQDAAVAELLAATLFTGTTRLGTRVVRWDTALRTGRLHAGRTAEWLILAGHCEASELPRLLGLLGERLAHPTYDEAWVAREARRIAQATETLRGHPRLLALRALNRIRRGDLSCFEEPPTDGAPARLTAHEVTEAHRRILTPHRAEILLVGAVTPDTARDLVGHALAAWQPPRPTATPAPDPSPPSDTPRTLIHRPASAQSTVAMSWSCLPFEDPGYTAQAVANAVFAGYFSSRLVTNIRERKGLTYHAASRFDRVLGTTSITLDVSCAPAATGQVVEEVLTDARRMVTDPPTPQETAHAHTFLAGSLLMATASPTDLTNLLATLGCWGIGPDWIEAYPRRLSETTADDVERAAARVFDAPPEAAVVVGDLPALTAPLARLGFTPHS